MAACRVGRSQSVVIRIVRVCRVSPGPTWPQGPGPRTRRHPSSSSIQPSTPSSICLRSIQPTCELWSCEQAPCRWRWRRLCGHSNSNVYTVRSTDRHSLYCHLLATGHCRRPGLPAYSLCLAVPNFGANIIERGGYRMWFGRRPDCDWASGVGLRVTASGRMSDLSV